MKEPTTVAELLRPVLDTYRDSAVAVVGCHSVGISRESCELDAVVVSNERRGPAAIRLGETFCDLSFITERESLSPTNPEIAVSLAHSKVVREVGLILSTSVAANRAVLGANSTRAAQGRLAACLKALSRADEALLKGQRRDANYWVLSASYEFARSWLHSVEVNPAPSHLLGQLRGHSKGGGKDFEAFTQGAGLEIASRKECGDRLEGLSVLYDLMSSRRGGLPAQTASADVGFMILRRKADHLASLKEHAEGYCFLGGEVARTVPLIGRSFRPAKGGRSQDRDLLSYLSDEGKGLLSGRLVKELGLERPTSEVEKSVSMLKERSASLARRI